MGQSQTIQKTQVGIDYSQQWIYSYYLDEKLSPVEFLTCDIKNKYQKEKIKSIILQFLTQYQKKIIKNSDFNNIDQLQCNICCCYSLLCCFDCCICNGCQSYQQDLLAGDFKKSLMHQYDPINKQYTQVRFYGSIYFDEIYDNYYLTSILNSKALEILNNIVEIYQNQTKKQNKKSQNNQNEEQNKKSQNKKSQNNENEEQNKKSQNNPFINQIQEYQNNEALKDQIQIVKHIWQSYDLPIIQMIIKKQEEFNKQCQFNEDKDFCIGKRCGYGIQTTPNSLYIGYFFNNKYHGKGRLWEFKNDTEFNSIENDFQKKQKEQFFAGERESELFDFIIKEKQQSGLFSKHVDDDKYKGWGEMKFDNGDIYKGQLKEKLMHGMGHYIWANGEEYLGEFKDGLRHGFGQFKTTYKREYLGQFRNGLQNGLALERKDKGRYSQTRWQDGGKLQ